MIALLVALSLLLISLPWLCAAAHTRTQLQRELAAQRLREAISPKCGHTMAEPVLVDAPPSPELRLVGWYCPDCDEKLPAAYQPPNRMDELMRETELDDTKAALAEAKRRAVAAEERVANLQRVIQAGPLLEFEIVLPHRPQKPRKR